MLAGVADADKATPILCASDEAYSVGNNLRSVEPQKTTTGSANAIPRVIVVRLDKVDVEYDHHSSDVLNEAVNHSYTANIVVLKSADPVVVNVNSASAVKGCEKLLTHVLGH